MEFRDLRGWIVSTIVDADIHDEECFIFEPAFAEAENDLLNEIVGPSHTIQPRIDRKMFSILPQARVTCFLQIRLTVCFEPFGIDDDGGVGGRCLVRQIHSILRSS